jgi:hypothetical protein
MNGSKDKKMSPNLTSNDEKQGEGQTAGSWEM